MKEFFKNSGITAALFIVGVIILYSFGVEYSFGNIMFGVLLPLFHKRLMEI